LDLVNAGYSSCVVHTIRPFNGQIWGAIIAYSKLPNLPVELRRPTLEDNHLWIQFASTILERRVLGEQLRVFEIRLDLAAKGGGMGIFDWDLLTDTLFWSPQLLEIYGISPTEFSGRYEDFRNVVVPEDLPNIEKRLQEALSNHERYFSLKHRFLKPSGEIRWLESLGEFIYGEDGRPIRLIGTAYDCTERVRVQEQVTEDRRRLELALEAGELGFWDWNIVTGQVQFGGEWAKMLGYSLEELKPRVETWERLVHPDDMPIIQEVLKKHLDGKTPYYESEHRLISKDGRWVWVLDRGRVVERDDCGRPLRALGIHANITAQKIVRETLRETDKRKDEFLATLAHELRNPLAPIRTGLAIIQKDPSSVAASKAREMMERQLAHMVRLIDDLLDVSRISTGRLRLKRERVSVKDIVSTAVEASQPLIDSGHHTLTCHLPEEELLINGDLTRLAQSLSNLLTNAAKYTPEGGQIELTVTRDDGILKICVSDNGLGVPQDMQEHIFDLFGQVNKTLDRAQGGLGIGLALVRTLIKLHGGEITVFSEGSGKGSTFTIQLPLQGSPDMASKGETMKELHQRTSKKRVLIVDDNIDAAKSLSLFVEMLGHTTHTAANGPDAVESVASFRPDIIFLDIGLPGMSGFEVAKIIRQLPEALHTQIIALTGWGTEETKIKTKEAGFNEHLIKPVELDRVESILNAQEPPSPSGEAVSEYTM
jgi:PAS domain S-box-containing protein